MTEDYVVLILALVGGICTFLAFAYALRPPRPGEAPRNAHEWQGVIELMFDRQGWVLLLLGAVLVTCAALTWRLQHTDLSQEVAYSESFYWALQTATTVGYGDGLHAGSNNFKYSETLNWMCCIWMLILVIYWANITSYVIGRWGTG